PGSLETQTSWPSNLPRTGSWAREWNSWDMWLWGENHLKVEHTPPAPTAGPPAQEPKKTCPEPSPAAGFDQRSTGSRTSWGSWLSARSRTNSYLTAASVVSLRAAAISSLFSAGGVAADC